jgi:dihydrofolate synthase/folylpolyglutamate synthase
MTESAGTGYERAQIALQSRWEHVMVPNLERIRDLLDILGSPQRAYPAVHLTGTNGKTSTARMVDALLQAHGLRTGRYTSPHLESVTERICIDGEPLTPERFGEVYDDIAPYIGIVDGRHEHRVTFFELTTALAFAAFAETPIDVAVVEVGLGGEWDATNVIDAAVSVVTRVEIDHAALLGGTVAKIAAEKAGIIHAGSTAVLALQRPEALAPLLARADAVGASVVREGLEFGVLSRELAVGGQQLALQGLRGIYDGIYLPLHGGYQAHNAAIALAAVEAFLGSGSGSDEPLDLATVQEAFASAESPGRLEVVRRGPTILLDGAHNPAGAEALVEALQEEFAFDHLVGVISVLADKDAAGMLERLEPVLAEVICTQSASPRVMAAEDLEAIAREIFDEDDVYLEERLDDAIAAAIQLVDRYAADHDGAGAGSGVLIAGSLVTVGEARALLGRRGPRR